LRKTLARKGYRVSERGKAELESALSELELAVEAGDHGRIEPLSKKVEEKANRHMAFARKSVGREYFESIGVAILVAVVLRLFVVEAFKIPSESMVPTLMVGDHIFVSKYLYGVSVPFTNRRLINFAAPAHGEVIVFVKPSVEEQTGLPAQTQLPAFFEEYEMVGKDFIKRIVALPGESVQMKDDVLFINDREVPRCRVGTRTYRSLNRLRDQWEDHEGELWVERHGDFLYTIVEEVDAPPSSFGPIRVPQGQVFVLGDNRDNSNDSRYWGAVPFDNIKGRAGMIWWSNRRPYGFQWDRLGSFIMHDPGLTPEQEAALEKCGLGN
jgi:signal peptidase I